MTARKFLLRKEIRKPRMMKKEKMIRRSMKINDVVVSSSSGVVVTAYIPSSGQRSQHKKAR